MFSSVKLGRKDEDWKNCFDNTHGHFWKDILSKTGWRKNAVRSQVSGYRFAWGCFPLRKYNIDNQIFFQLQFFQFSLSNCFSVFHTFHCVQNVSKLSELLSLVCSGSVISLLSDDFCGSALQAASKRVFCSAVMAPRSRGKAIKIRFPSQWLAISTVFFFSPFVKILYFLVYFFSCRFVFYFLFYLPFFEHIASIIVFFRSLCRNYFDISVWLFGRAIFSFFMSIPAVFVGDQC